MQVWNYIEHGERNDGIFLSIEHVPTEGQTRKMDINKTEQELIRSTLILRCTCTGMVQQKDC